jgi:Tfp pilus assembly protein PilF
MLTDRYGLPLTTTSQAARDAYVAGTDCMLAGIAGVQENLERAVAIDPDFALAHVALARSLFLRTEVAPARAAAARARALAVNTTPREQGHVDALALAVEGRVPDSLEATRAHVAAWPRDAVALSPATGVFGMIGFSGRAGRETELYELLAGLAPHYGEDWWYLSMLAFAACECGRLDEAARLIERSLAGNPVSAHGAHVKAHVLYETGETQAGYEFLERWLPQCAREGLMHCHLSWHVALFALTLGKRERAWEAYRTGVHPGGSWGPPLNVATDAPSFLWRAELAGEARQPGLWREARDYASERFPRAGGPLRGRARRGSLRGDRRARRARQAARGNARAPGRRETRPGFRRARARGGIRGLRPGRLERRDPRVRRSPAGDGAHRGQPGAARSRRAHAVGRVPEGWQDGGGGSPHRTPRAPPPGGRSSRLCRLALVSEADRPTRRLPCRFTISTSWRRRNPA